MSRIEALKEFLNQDPKDSFSRYALGMEYGKIGRDEDAIREFETVIENDPGYVATYYQLGKVFERRGQQPEAADTYRAGIEVAGGAGDQHTREELEAALEELSEGV
jgi:tetratricopeptide (TPR) repeat protein